MELEIVLFLKIIKEVSTMGEFNDKDVIIMKLLHYFITEQNYNPVVLHGAKNEIWLENMNSEYKIVRLVSNYIHNNEQMEMDIFRTEQIMQKIKKTHIQKLVLHHLEMMSSFISQPK